ncbi:hypothetical protein Srufu_012540 [Streptomyces libani subsp. rufus]|nr:hypothetical protein Srufu_012540 [Streptomyces libani subsp. rufus]
MDRPAKSALVVSGARIASRISFTGCLRRLGPPRLGRGGELGEPLRETVGGTSGVVRRWCRRFGRGGAVAAASAGVAEPSAAVPWQRWVSAVPSGSWECL